MISPQDFYDLGASKLPLDRGTCSHRSVNATSTLTFSPMATAVTTAAATSDPTKRPFLEDSSAPVPPSTAAIVFDTETSGIGTRAVVIQLAVGYFDHDGKLLRMYDELWKLPRGRGISKEAQKVHKIDRKRLNTRGRSALPQIARIEQSMREARRRSIPIVAFNAAFDCRLLRQTALAHGVSDQSWTLREEHTVCLMKRSRPHSGLRTLTGRRCGFSNASLYEHLLRRAPEQVLHDAAADVEVTAACYFAGCHKRWW